MLFKLNPLTKTLAGGGVGEGGCKLSDTISNCLEKQKIKQATEPPNLKENSNKTHLLIYLFYFFKASFKDEVGFISKGAPGGGGCPDRPPPAAPAGQGPVPPASPSRTPPGPSRPLPAARPRTRQEPGDRSCVARPDEGAFH